MASLKRPGVGLLFGVCAVLAPVGAAANAVPRFDLFPSVTRGPPSPEVVQRIQDARASYLDEIAKLGRELVELRRRKEKVDDDLLRTAIRFTMTDWAKRARISEVLEPDVF